MRKYIIIILYSLYRKSTDTHPVPPLALITIMDARPAQDHKTTTTLVAAAAAVCSGNNTHVYDPNAGQTIPYTTTTTTAVCACVRLRLIIIIIIIILYYRIFYTTLQRTGLCCYNMRHTHTHQHRLGVALPDMSNSITRRPISCV